MSNKTDVIYIWAVINGPTIDFGIKGLVLPKRQLVDSNLVHFSATRHDAYVIPFRHGTTGISDIPP